MFSIGILKYLTHSATAIPLLFIYVCGFKKKITSPFIDFLYKMLSKLLSNEKLTELELKEIKDLEKKLNEFTKTRKFEEKQDLSYLDKMRNNKL